MLRLSTVLFINVDSMTGFYKRRISSIVPLPASDLTQCIPSKSKNHLYVEQISARVKNALMKIDDDPNLSEDDRKVLVRCLRRLEPMEQYIFNTAHMKKIYGDVLVERFFSSLDCNMA
ncbi:hypothetical protein MHB85_16120 [Paenibacillus sp. FSL K6-4396]|uniref:hypothetical protein n=1 Tax=unclassified Paenibacillus TaxID=185978 RepID=UPI001FD4BBF9|nr:hypothetical protein [Paenibacillus sp. CFBP 13594]